MRPLSFTHAATTTAAARREAILCGCRRAVPERTARLGKSWPCAAPRRAHLRCHTISPLRGGSARARRAKTARQRSRPKEKAPEILADLRGFCLKPGGDLL